METPAEGVEPVNDAEPVNEAEDTEEAELELLDSPEMDVDDTYDTEVTENTEE